MNTPTSLLVFFDTSTLSDVTIWRTYLQALSESHGEAPHDWETYTRQWNVDSPREERERLYMDIVHALGKSDVAIFDITIPSMRMGHEITLALQKHIPILLLVNKQSRRPDSLFLQAVSSPHVRIKSYTDTFDLLMQMRLFLKKYTTGVKKRLDIALEENLHAFVAREAQRKGITQTEMMHEILHG